MTAKKWSAAKWVEYEIDSLVDAYGEDRDWQALHVQDMLEADEYRDELTERQTAAALRYVRKLRAMK